MNALAPSTVAVVVVLGGVGAAVRLVVDSAVNRRWPGRFPLATLVVNVTGSLLIGLLTALLGSSSPELYAVGATGFCGGYTTFSTSMMEAVRLAREGGWRTAALATVTTLVLCVAAASLGVLVGGALC